jgi:hypothetical protein
MPDTSTEHALDASTEREEKRAALIEQLAMGSTVKAAAEAVGISYATARRWLGEPDVALALVAAQEQALDAATARIGAAASAAVGVLVSLMRPEEPAHVRVKAASVLVSAATKLRDRRLIELEARLARLEGVA